MHRKKKEPPISQSFSIEHVDAMGQGVDKSHSKITFIEKVLPGETGRSKVYAGKKGVQFAELESLEKTSKDRIEPQCIHYAECGGCHYLHCDYEKELEFKVAALEWIFRKTERLPSLEIYKAPNRFNYRNRMQLHYDTRKSKIGHVGVNRRNIISTPECLMPVKEIKELYESVFDSNFIPRDQPITGHVEIWASETEAKFVFNKSYAHEGFKQVNGPMNEKLKEVTKSWITDKNQNLTGVIDLFGGDGNLSSELNFLERVVIDHPPKRSDCKNSTFIDLNLFKNSPSNYLKFHKCSLLIVDPPRKGFNNLAQWIEFFNPELVLYVSCKADTMYRDLSLIQVPFQIKNIGMFDLFPGTKHFEAALLLAF